MRFARCGLKSISTTRIMMSCARAPSSCHSRLSVPGPTTRRRRCRLGTWHSSQWRGLAKCPNDLPAIPLPGVIINGHSWSFVASAIKDGRSVLYSEVELGKTSTGFGIITTPVAPQHLARWAENSNWPISKSEILDTWIVLWFSALILFQLKPGNSVCCE